ncbi:hypothetical protein V6Z11_D05G060100 [Gossypium hirsutum]
MRQNLDKNNITSSILSIIHRKMLQRLNTDALLIYFSFFAYHQLFTYNHHSALKIPTTCIRTQFVVINDTLPLLFTLHVNFVIPPIPVNVRQGRCPVLHTIHYRILSFAQSRREGYLRFIPSDTFVKS